MTPHTITLSESDYARLSNLVNHGGTIAEALGEELERATVRKDNRMPDDIVRMHSTVEYRDLLSGATRNVTIVYPPQADMNSARVSVLAPIGAALIGLRVGQVIDWALPNAKTVRLQVTGVTHDETATGEVRP